jgi:hypothetical protein
VIKDKYLGSCIQQEKRIQARHKDYNNNNGEVDWEKNTLVAGWGENDGVRL